MMNKQNTILIPADVVELSHIRPSEHIAVHIGENTLVVVPEKLTALQAVNAIALLTDVGSGLISIIKDACGACADHMKQGGCPFGGMGGPGECPYKDMDGPEVELSDPARRKLGIPLDAKLELLPDEGEGLVCAADYDHDITDVPPIVRQALALAGICPGRLDDLIMSGEIIHEA